MRGRVRLSADYVRFAHRGLAHRAARRLLELADAPVYIGLTPTRREVVEVPPDPELLAELELGAQCVLKTPRGHGWDRTAQRLLRRLERRRGSLDSAADALTARGTA